MVFKNPKYSKHRNRALWLVFKISKYSYKNALPYAITFDLDRIRNNYSWKKQRLLMNVLSLIIKIWINLNTLQFSDIEWFTAHEKEKYILLLA